MRRFTSRAFTSVRLLDRRYHCQLDRHLASHTDQRIEETPARLAGTLGKAMTADLVHLVAGHSVLRIARSP